MNNDKAVTGLSALAQPHRLTAFRLLVRAGSDGMTAGALAAALDLPPSSLSFHIAHLHRADLVTQKRDGRSLIYSANFDAMSALIAYLLENCCTDERAATLKQEQST
ncbi:MAG: metalloregulator ArsR/SmtB family transcription factor [Pacificimonas sp.]